MTPRHRGNPLNDPQTPKPPGMGLRGGGSDDYRKNGGAAVGQFVDSMLRLWPILVFLTGLFGWGISVEVRMAQIPAEVPPAWFKAEVDSLGDKLEDVEEGVTQNGREIAEMRGQLRALEKLPRFGDGP